MKKKLTLLFILLLLFSTIIWLVFGDFIKILFNSSNFKSALYKNEKPFINKWIVDKVKTEGYLRTNYPNGQDSINLEELISFRNNFMDSVNLNIFENGNYEQTVKGFSTLVTIGQWRNEDGYLILTEKSKKNSMQPILSSKPENFITYYFKVIKIDRKQMILFLDLTKTLNIPQELKLLKNDTVFYMPTISY